MFSFFLIVFLGGGGNVLRFFFWGGEGEAEPLFLGGDVLFLVFPLC